MSYYKRNNRDKSEKRIVQALRDVGAFVLQLSGRGIPDLLVSFRGTWTPLEVKTPKADRARGNLDAFTPAQHQVMAIAPYPVVETEAEALKAIGAVRSSSSSKDQRA